MRIFLAVDRYIYPNEIYVVLVTLGANISPSVITFIVDGDLEIYFFSAIFVTTLFIRLVANLFFYFRLNLLNVVGLLNFDLLINLFLNLRLKNFAIYVA